MTQASAKKIAVLIEESRTADPIKTARNSNAPFFPHISIYLSGSYNRAFELLYVRPLLVLLLFF